MNALRKRRRMIEHDSLAKDARFWRKVPTGLPVLYHMTPINRQAQRAIGDRKKQKSRFAPTPSSAALGERTESKRQKKQLTVLRERWAPYLSDCLRLGISPEAVPEAIELEIEKAGSIRCWLDLHTAVSPGS